MSGRNRLSTLSVLLLAVALIILVGGLVYDGVREGEDPDLSSLYVVAIALCLVSMLLGYRARGGRDG